MLIEDAASGQSLIQALKAETRLPILPVKPQGDKVSRAHAVSPLVESGRVSVPPAAPWLADFLDELASFPAAAHDDMVDALTQALNWMRGSFWDSEDFQRTQAQFSELRRRERSANASGFFNNVNDMLAAEDGIVSPSGQRFTNPTAFSRIRGGF